MVRTTRPLNRQDGWRAGAARRWQVTRARGPFGQPEHCCRGDGAPKRASWQSAGLGRSLATKAWRRHGKRQASRLPRCLA